MPERILHVALAADWRQAHAAGSYRVSSRERTLADEGFVHASTRAQVDHVLATYYADVDPAGLNLLVLDVDTLQAAGSPVRWETVPGAPQPFPHVYGPVPVGAVVAVLPLSGSTGRVRLPDLSDLGVVPGRPG